MLRKILCLAATALATQAASADVLYTWQQVQASPSMPDGLHLDMLFTDEAVAKGELELEVVNQCPQGYCVRQQDSLLSLRYWFDGAGGTPLNLIDYRLDDETRWGYDRLSMKLSFLADGQLSGSIAANDGFSDFLMESEGALFTMVAARSDEPYGCGYAHPSCAGATGLLQGGHVARKDAEVPEPAAPAILAIGALAAWAARRRRPFARTQR